MRRFHIREVEKLGQAKKGHTVAPPGEEERPSGIAHIRSTFNNTIVTITDKQGNVLSWSSSGTRALRVPERARPSLPAWRPRLRRGLPWSTACVRSKCT